MSTLKSKYNFVKNYLNTEEKGRHLPVGMRDHFKFIGGQPL